MASRVGEVMAFLGFAYATFSLKTLNPKLLHFFQNGPLEEALDMPTPLPRLSVCFQSALKLHRVPGALHWSWSDILVISLG